LIDLPAHNYSVHQRSNNLWVSSLHSDTRRPDHTVPDDCAQGLDPIGSGRWCDDTVRTKGHGHSSDPLRDACREEGECAWMAHLGNDETHTTMVMRGFHACQDRVLPAKAMAITARNPTEKTASVMSRFVSGMSATLKSAMRGRPRDPNSPTIESPDLRARGTRS